MTGDNKPALPKKLGFFNRTLLSIAALAKGIGGIMKEDSQRSRAAFWAYASTGGVIGVAALALGFLPGPNVIGLGLLLGSSLVFAGAVKGLAAAGLPWAQQKNEKFLKDVFNGEALIKRYDAYILPKEKNPGEFYVHKRSLLADTFNRVSTDVDTVVPTPLRCAGAFVMKYIATPAFGFMTSVFNRVTGKTPEPDKPQDKDPPAPGPQP